MYKVYFVVTVAVCISIIGINSQTKLVRPYCMGCMCQALTNCSKTFNGGNLIGMMKISEFYWIDAGKELIGNLNFNFEQCARHSKCATLAVENYMNRYKKDCNEDGKIDCVDFSLIHVYGPFNCNNKTLPEQYLKDFKQCLTCQYGVALEFGEDLESK